MIIGSASIPPARLKVLSVACISLAALSRPPTLAATAAGVGLVLFLWSLRADQSTTDVHSFRWAGVAVISILLFRMTGLAGRLTEPDVVISFAWFALLLVASVLTIVRGHHRGSRLLSLLLASVAVLSMTVGMTVVEWRSDLGLDVYWMHREAGEAMLDGENPYTDAVTVSNGSPFAPEGAVIEGYPYPPVVVGTYALAGAELDPRLVSGVAWLAVLFWLGLRARRPGAEGDTAYAMFMLLAGLAVWPVVWFASWTEPLSVLLVLLAAHWWRRRPGSAAVALGLALASKQYFIFLAPLLFMHRDQYRWMRVVTSLGVAAGAILIGLLPEPGSFVTATLLNLTEIGNRPDTQSLSGLLAANGVEFYLSAVAWIGIGFGLAAILAWRSRTASDFVGRMGLTMGIVFFVGQAFPNYWFLVLTLLAMASVLEPNEAEAGREARARPSQAQPIEPVA